MPDNDQTPGIQRKGKRSDLVDEGRAARRGNNKTSQQHVHFDEAAAICCGEHSDGGKRNPRTGFIHTNLVTTFSCYTPL